MEVRKVFLIDGTAFCYRAFHGLISLATSDGRPTNAVYGFAMMLQALRDKESPAYLAVAFDVGKPTFRHHRYEAYKEHRKPMPDALSVQIPVIKELLKAYRVAMFELEGYEGEDVLATIARQVVRPGIEVLLVTSDKDALQLVNGRIKVYNPQQGGVVIDAQAVRKRFGVGPEQMVDLMALMGDETDDIPGVPGIGAKTAAKLLQQFGSLEQLYDRLDEIKSPAQRQRLASARESAELSQELARIDHEVPLDATLEDLAVQDPDWARLRTMFRDLEFRRLLAALERMSPSGPGHAVTVHLLHEASGLEEFTRTVTDSHTPLGIQCVPVDASQETGRVLRIAIATGPEDAWVGTLDAEILQKPAGRRLARWLADPSAKKLGHDLKKVHQALAAVSCAFDGWAGDTLLAAYLLNPARTSQQLSDVVEEIMEESLSGLPADGGTSPEQLQVLGQQACAVLRLHERLVERLRVQELEPLYREVELPLIPILADMERAGIAVDLPYLERLRESMAGELTRMTEELYRLAGTTFNLNSPKQLAQVLFERLGLPVIKRTKTGASTDAEVLHRLAPQHPLPAGLINYRELSKLVSTYVEALPKLVNPSTGRIHTSFNQAGTVTGRLSSSSPNLQNIPVKTDLGRQIRAAFIPGKGYDLLIAVDYSQIELRILAHLSKDETLMDVFRQGRDVHRYTASLIYGLPEAEVQPDQRNAMKAVNFGILYGMSAHGLAKQLEMSYEEAQSFIDAYFERYPKVRRYMDEQIERAKANGFVQTLLGRRRYIPELQSPDMAVRQFGERIAVNTPVQGSAADLMKRAMIDVSEALSSQQLSSRMILQVHDELIFEVPQRERQAVIDLARIRLERVLPLGVPLTVIVKAGPNWLDLEPVS